MIQLNENRSEKLTLLAGILNKVDNFDITKFEGRLIFQKTVYFLQAFKIYLGYSFTLYVHGPYSPALTRDGFEKLKGKVGQATELEFPYPETKENFRRFLSFIEPFKDNPSDLEVLASLHLFKRLYPSKEKNEIIKLILEMKPYLKKETCEEDWKVLEKFGLV